ncbi:MAG TPA: terpene cyclase/mutase family protein [Pirellulales bacterium]
MESSRTIIVPTDGIAPPSFVPAYSPTVPATVSDDTLTGAIARTRDWLLAQQNPDGHWVAELEGDTILESEYIIFLAYLGRHRSTIARKAARYIAEKQLPSGGWSLYPGGSLDISASVKGYFALKLTGHDPSARHMQRARQAILTHGGADAVNSFTRFYLALLGQIEYNECPAVPPEVMLAPRWFPVHLYSVSAWSRTILVPLSIMRALEPVTQIEPHLGIRELFLKEPRDWPPLRCPGLEGGTGPLSWDRFFRQIDRALRLCQRKGWTPFRKRALAAAERWMVERFSGSDGLGAIFPPMIWSIIALRSLGYAENSLELRYCYERLDGLIIEEEETARLQPCKSPVWDTAIALRALSSSGVSPKHEAVAPAVEWLLDRQIERRGDWAQTVKAEAGGWCFEHANEFYPDLDDTAMVLMALADQFASSDRPVAPRKPVADDLSNENVEAAAMLDRATQAIRRGEDWVLAMQNRDGGWGAFDRDNTRQFLCHVPFADHNAMIDPSTPDLTARVLESLGQLGRRVGDPMVDRGVNYLRSAQEADGSWFGRWGVNYIYGTWQALIGLRAVGVPTHDPQMVRGANWLLAWQQTGGGWGESPDSYADPHKRGQGPVTASQTAWAVMALLAAGMRDHPATARGVKYLVDAQNDDGTWTELEFTGTGFPRVFYLRYHWYPIYFPLMALSQWATPAPATLPSAVSTQKVSTEV